MHRGLLRARRHTAEESGFTLPELLVAMVLAMIVIGAGVMAFSTAMRSQPRVNSQAEAIQRARTMMERMVREVRQGSTVPVATSSQLAVVTYVHDTSCGTTTPQCRVTYTCAAGACTRSVARPDGTAPGPSVKVIDGLSSNNVFTYTAPTTTTGASVAITLALSAAGGASAITLTDAAALRNPGVP